jgi:hypothetical protein
MQELTSADVMPGVLIKKSLEKTGGTTKEQSAREAGKNIVDKANNDEVRKAIEATQRKKPIEQKNIDRKLDEIGTNRDPDGKKNRTTEERDRFEKADRAAKLAKKLTEQGYDKLDPGEKSKLISIVRDKIKASPLHAAGFDSLGAGSVEQTAEIEGRLRNPKFAADLSENVNTLLGSESIKVKEEEILERKDDVDVKGKVWEREETAHKDADTKVIQLEAEIKAFEKNASGDPIGDKAKRLKDLSDNLPTMQVELKGSNSALNIANTRLEKLNKTKAGYAGRNVRQEEIDTLDAAIAEAGAEAISAQGKVNELENKIKELDTLKTQEASLKEEKLKAESERSDKYLSLQKAKTEFSKSQRRYEDQKRERVYQEEDFANSLDDVFSRTADKFVADELQEAEKAVSLELKEFNKNAVNPDEAAVANGLRQIFETSEYYKTGFRGKGPQRERIVTNKVEANSRFMDAMKNGNTDNTLRDALTRAGYGTDQIDTLFADKSHGSFYQKMSDEVGLQIIKRKTLAGGFSKDDSKSMENSQWGESMVRLAVSKNKEGTSAVEAKIGEKAADLSKFVPKLWDEAKKKPWLLALLFGATALPFLAVKQASTSTTP